MVFSARIEHNASGIRKKRHFLVAPEEWRTAKMGNQVAWFYRRKG